MNGDLADWERRLEGHFRELATIRGAATGGRPLFALEHDLQPTEVEVLRATIREHIAHRSPHREHTLAWIVYAAEFGYQYSGDEYWQTFEQETPGWTVHGDRYWIRERYRAFQRQYGGAKPSGAWAEQFSIICWPITHAILPSDLQRQLARILYEIRHSFSAELLESPVMLGEFIEAQSWNATSRFQNLAQETALVGQIAAALLLQGQFGTDNLVYPSTLERISKDLDRERRAREWLRGARRSAQERARIRGLALGSGTPSTIRRPEEARAEVVVLGIEPRFVLRPLDPARTSWEVSLEVPDLSHLLLRFPRTRESLTGARCVVAGAAGRPLARGRCLHGPQRVVLARWPRPDEVLLKFERTHAQLEYLLRAECLLRPGPSWLFRIASDGLAYEMRGLRVRPGERYILVRASSPIEVGENAQPVDIQCEGVHGLLLTLPSALTSRWEVTLRRLGLGQARAIEVWPAGLSAVLWDGEGHGEWLASERPCLGIRSDHPIDALVVSMASRSEAPLELTPIVPGEPVFVELAALPVGLHRVRVCARDTPGVETEALGDLEVMMRIREARPWSPGVSPHGPLVVQIDPATPILEHLWEGRVSLTLRGPSGRGVRCRVSLFERDGDTAIFVKQLPPIRFPVGPDAWRSHFEKHFRRTKQAQDVYDIARICELEFAAEELGALTVRCEREFTPLRWAVRCRGQRQMVRLLDDSGDDRQPIVSRLAFESPCVEEQLACDSVYEVPEVGGMYVARGGRTVAAVIVPPLVRSLAELGCVPRVDAGTRSVDSILQLLGLACLWGQARVTGAFVSAMRQRYVLLAFLQHMFRLICGDNWANVEASSRDGAFKISRLRGAVSRRRDEVAIGAVLARDVADLAERTCEDRVKHMASLATRFRLLSSPPDGEGVAEWLSELVLRLASDPANVEAWAGERLREGLNRLLEVPTLARAARFLVLATDGHLKSRVAPGELYASWGWA